MNASTPLTVLVVAENRKTLRELARILEALGYRVWTAAGTSTARAVLAGRTLDFLIVTPRFVGLIPTTAGSPYTLLLLDGCTPHGILDGLEKGVDDFLTTPCVFGEVLTRLRAGARIREFCRRFSTIERGEGANLIENQEFVVDRVGRLLVSLSDRRRAAALVLIQVDGLSGFPPANRGAERKAAVALVEQLLEPSLEDADLVVRPADDVLAVVFAGRSESDAARWAEDACLSIAASAQRQPWGDGPSASFGVAAAADASAGAGDLVTAAAQALELARISGQGTVIRASEMADHAKGMAVLAVPGALFERTEARHVMTPLFDGATVDQPAGALRSRFQSTNVPAVPVLDGEGRLMGAVFEEDLSQAGDETPVGDILRKDIPTFSETTPFSSLMAFFTEKDEPLAIVVDHGLPTGLVTRNTLIALSETITAETFREVHEPDGNPLIVPDLCPLS
jgi:GGDEF domain-containing protein